jgi:DNA polymerase, archaea type
MSDKSRYVWTDSVWRRDRLGRPRVLIFGRNYDDKFKTIVTEIEGFIPYFYIPSSYASLTVCCPITYTVHNDVYIDALGRNIKKVTCTLPSDVPKLRDRFEWTDEADILFDKRYLIDNNIWYAYDENGPVKVDKILSPRVAFFDIEVRSDSVKVPKPEQSAYPIVSIQILDSYTHNVMIFTFGVPQIAPDQVACNTEEEMLRRFADYINKLDPDVLCGWYSNKFDLPYIIRRSENLNVNINGLTRTNGTPYANKTLNGWNIKVTGRQCFDFYDAFKKYYAPKGQLAAYDLKSVVSNEDVQGKGKAFKYKDEGGNINGLFESEDWETFLQYCRNDIVALDIINNNLTLIDFYEYMRLIAGVKLEETLMNSRIVESLLMRNGIKPMPTKSYSDKVTESFEGALVMNPPIGIHENVGVVDLTALYPNIIVGFDVSPDIDHVVPRVIKTAMDERDKLRKLKLEGNADEVTKNKETVLKFLANSFYGVLGWTKFRLYNAEQAAFITRIGRELNEYLQLLAKEEGLDPIYGDTDSVFIKGVVSVEEGIQLQSRFNDALARWSDEHNSSVHFTLKFEKMYRKIIFKVKSSGEVAKKRYAGHLVWKEGDGDVSKLDSTGIELKRSDQAEITKSVLKEFLNDILINDDVDGALHKLRSVVHDVEAGKVSIHKISIPRGVSDPNIVSPWSRGMANLTKLYNINLAEGAKPRLIYTKGNAIELCIDNDMDEEFIKSKVEIDWKKSSNKVLKMKMETFVESIGYKWDEVIGGQIGLDKWF